MSWSDFLFKTVVGDERNWFMKMFDWLEEFFLGDM